MNSQFSHYELDFTYDNSDVLDWSTFHFQYLRWMKSGDADIFRIYLSRAALHTSKVSSESNLPLQFYDWNTGRNHVLNNADVFINIYFLKKLTVILPEWIFVKEHLTSSFWQHKNYIMKVWVAHFYDFAEIGGPVRGQVE